MMPTQPRGGCTMTVWLENAPITVLEVSGGVCGAGLEWRLVEVEVGLVGWGRGFVGLGW